MLALLLISPISPPPRRLTTLRGFTRGAPRRHCFELHITFRWIFAMALFRALRRAIFLISRAPAEAGDYNISADAIFLNFSERQSRAITPLSKRCRRFRPLRRYGWHGIARSRVTCATKEGDERARRRDFASMRHEERHWLIYQRRVR